MLISLGSPIESALAENHVTNISQTSDGSVTIHLPLLILCFSVIVSYWS